MEWHYETFGFRPTSWYLSVKRKGSTLISHGFTRLRKGDIVTVVGSPKSVESVMLRLDKQD